VETSIAAQQASIATMTKQFEKLRIRTRIVSRDVRGALKELGAGMADHTEMLRGAAGRLDQVESGVLDLEGMVGAMQEVASKQLNLLRIVVAAQQKQQQRNESHSQPLPTPTAPHKGHDEGTQGARIENEGGSIRHHKALNIAEERVDPWGRSIASRVSENCAKKATGTSITDEEGCPAKGTASSSSAAAGSPGVFGGAQMTVNDDGSVSFTF